MIPCAKSTSRGAMLHLCIQIDKAVFCVHGCRIDLPIDLHRYDVFDVFHESLIAQIAEHERFGRGAERHEREDFAFVHVYRERMFTRDMRRARMAVLVKGGNLKGCWPSRFA